MKSKITCFDEESMPEPVGKIVAAVGGFNDVAMIQWTGTYRPTIGDLIYVEPPRCDEMKDQTVISAFELVRKHGFIEAQRLSDQWRDMNSPGTISYSLHNAVSKQIQEFAKAGAMYRTVGKVKK